MSEQTQHLVERLRQRLHATVRRITLADLAYGAVLTVGILIALWLVAAAVEAGFWLEVTPRSALFWTLLVVAVGLTGLFLVRPLLQLLGVLSPPSEETVARRIGARYPEVEDRLVNLLDLVDGRRSDAPSPMLDGAVRMLGEPLQDVPFEQVERFERARRASRLATLPLVGLFVALLVAPGPFLDATQRLLSPGEHFQRPAPFQLTIEPGDTDLVKGASLDVTIRPMGETLPRTLTLELNHLDEDLVDTVTLTADSTGAFRHNVVNVRKPLRYRAVAEPVRTAWYTATVTERPLVRALRVHLDFPAYTGIPSQDLAPNAGDVTALPGTRVRVEVQPGGADVDEALLRFDDSTTVPLTLENGRATGQFTLRREGTYQVNLHTAQGLTNKTPIEYQMQLLTDAAPSVLLLDPDATTDLDDALRTQLRMRLNDDFGFSRLRLYYRLSQSRFGTVDSTFSTIDLPLNRPTQLDQEITYDWLLSQTTDLDPVPGDVIEYYVQVWDNDTVAGYKSSRSATQRLRLPSLEERFERLDETQDDAEQQMEDLLQDTDDMKEEFEQLRDELRRKQEGDWEDERQLERLRDQQQQMEERVDQLSRQMEDISRQMQENDLVSPETLEKYEELQRVAEEIQTPELQDALKQLQEAMDQLNMQQMQESLQDFEFNEQQYRQRLERTLELFKQLRVQQKLEEAARRAEELAKRQEQLAEKTEQLDENDAPQQESPKDGEDSAEDEQSREDTSEENSSEEQQETDENTSESDEASDQESDREQTDSETEPSESESSEDQQESSETGEQQPTDQRESLAQEQERSSEEMRELEKQLEELRKQMDEVDNAPRKEMDQLQEQTKQQQLPQQMQQNAQQLRQGQKQQAQQQQQQMQQQLQQMQQQLQMMMQGMQQQQKQINMAGLRQALSDILTLSDQQETLRGTVEASAPDSPTLRQHAQRQVDLSEGLTTVSDSLQALASDIPQMTSAVQEETGNALRAMSRSTEALSERSQRTATGLQKTSMMHLNELALLLSDLMEQMQNQQGGGGGMSMQQMMQQLQQMSGQQQKLNQQIQQMLNDVQGNRLSTDMQQRLRQMAAQQDALRRQLKELSRNRELGEKALGDLKKVAEEMEETIRNLQRGRVDRPMVQRQQRILTRLLNATKSIQKRGKEEKREGKSADDIMRESPSELPPQEQAEQLRRALLRALESGYAPDYENLIKRYFELLQEQQTPASGE